jgi:hypothetical protein
MNQANSTEPTPSPIPIEALAEIAAQMGFSPKDIAMTLGANPGPKRLPTETEARPLRRMSKTGRLLRFLGNFSDETD